MQTNFMAVNGVYREILIDSQDAEKTYGSVIDDGSTRYYVTPYRCIQQGGKYYYWFIVNSKERFVLPDDAKQQLAVMTLNQAQQATTITALQQANAALMLKLAGGK